MEILVEEESGGRKVEEIRKEEGTIMMKHDVESPLGHLHGVGTVAILDAAMCFKGADTVSGVAGKEDEQNEGLQVSSELEVDVQRCSHFKSCG